MTYLSIFLTESQLKQLLTLFSKLYLLRSLDSVALLSPWVRAPCEKQSQRLEMSAAEERFECFNMLHTEYVTSTEWKWNKNFFFKVETRDVPKADYYVWKRNYAFYRTPNHSTEPLKKYKMGGTNIFQCFRVLSQLNSWVIHFVYNLRVSGSCNQYVG